MALEEDFLERFGPKLLQAMSNILCNEVNILRHNAGLPMRTKDQFLQKFIEELEEVDNNPILETNGT